MKKQKSTRVRVIRHGCQFFDYENKFSSTGNSQGDFELSHNTAMDTLRQIFFLGVAVQNCF